MLSRMMVDISKWIVIIIIFFIAFACSLFLIFSYFAVVLEQQNILIQLATAIESTTSTPIIQDNSTISNNPQCPDYFYELLNQSVPIIIDNTDNSGDDNTDDNNTCAQSSQYTTIKRVGPYPGIYYFGQSFGSTMLTTFFTLFGVIGENGVPVSIHINRLAKNIDCFD
jgi:hypothetical protein